VAVLRVDGKLTVEEGPEPGEYQVPIVPPPSEEAAGTLQVTPSKEFPGIPLECRSVVTSDRNVTFEASGSHRTFGRPP
jgi:hypothetical protein